MHFSGLCLSCLNAFPAPKATKPGRGFTGIISTIAGTGTPGYGGDGGAATSARLTPFLMDIDQATGDFYFSTLYTCVVRKVSAAGVISTVAAPTLPGYSLALSIPASDRWADDKRGVRV